MGLGCGGHLCANTMFGFPADEWKDWQLNGLDIQVPKTSTLRSTPKEHDDLSRR